MLLIIASTRSADNKMYTEFKQNKNPGGKWIYYKIFEVNSKQVDYIARRHQHLTSITST